MVIQFYGKKPAKAFLFGFLMKNYSTSIPVCNNDWARRHAFLNKVTGQVIPARCGTWKCLPCAKMNTRRVYGLIHAGKPNKFITLSFAGKSKETLTSHYNALVKRIRRQGWEYQAVAVNEIHLSGDLHLHVAARGDFIPATKENPWLWDNWLDIIKDDYPHFTTVNARIEAIEQFEDPQKALYSYMTKYMVKTWETNNQKDWDHVQNLYPGLRHYRYTQGWINKPVEAIKKPSDWHLIPETVARPIEGDYNPLKSDSVDVKFLDWVKTIPSLAMGTREPSSTEFALQKALAPDFWI